MAIQGLNQDQVSRLVKAGMTMKFLGTRVGRLSKRKRVGDKRPPNDPVSMREATEEAWAAILGDLMKVEAGGSVPGVTDQVGKPRGRKGRLNKIERERKRREKDHEPLLPERVVVFKSEVPEGWFAGGKAVRRQAVDWVASHLYAPVKPQDAPSGVAWGLLQFVRSSPAAEAALWTKVIDRAVPRQVGQEAEAARDEHSRDVRRLTEMMRGEQRGGAS